jgi:hypothetical protein
VLADVSAKKMHQKTDDELREIPKERERELMSNNSMVWGQQ